MNHKGFVGLAVLIVVLGAGYYEMVKFGRATFISDANQLPVWQGDQSPASSGQSTGSTIAPASPVATPAASESAPTGMSQYTDTDLGFSFWYPRSWNVQNIAVQYPNDYPGSYVVKMLSIENAEKDKSIMLYELTSSEPSVTFGTGHGMTRHYFDTTTHMWMTGHSGSSDGYIQAWPATPADISLNTMGGLHMLSGPSTGAPYVLPLSGHHFLIVSAPYLTADSVRSFTQTIVATDPSVATPVSAAQQQAAIAAEAQAFGVEYTAPATALKTYTDSVNGFSFTYPASLPLNIPNPATDSVGVTLATLTSGPEVLTISMNTDPTVVGHCMVTPQSYEDGVSNAATVTLHGVSFLSYNIDDAATGHYTDEKIYHAIHNNACFALTKTTSTSRVSSDEESKSQADSVNTASALFDPIIQSFTFAANTIAVPPTCTLTSDKFMYKLGDVITLSWTSKNANRALWDQAAEQNTGIRKVLIAPEGTPAVSGTAPTIANLEGYQPITLQVTGPGGFGTCTLQVSVNHSDAKPSITVDSVRFTGTNGLYNNDRNVSVTLSGTATNGGLFNNEVNIVLFDPAYLGPFDEASIYRIAFGYNGQFYSGGTQPGVREDSLPYTSWSEETFIPHGVTQVRVLAYYPFYSADSPTSSNAQPIVNEVLTVSQ